MAHPVERSGAAVDDPGPDEPHPPRQMAHPTRPERPRSAVGEGPRPFLERLGMAAIAVVLGLLFAGVAVAAYLGGELFLAVMAAIGSLMTLWVGALTLVRG